MSAQLLWDTTMATTYIDYVMTSVSLVSLGPASMVVDCPMPTLEDVTNAES